MSNVRVVVELFWRFLQIPCKVVPKNCFRSALEWCSAVVLASPYKNMSEYTFPTVGKGPCHSNDRKNAQMSMDDAFALGYTWATGRWFELWPVGAF